MNRELWNKILAFDFDRPSSEYGFSTRLSSENYWTKEFTETALLEYKKFMYLAASSDLMVSPSEIVDVVWHQHLVFSKSYHEFCQLIGKVIHHIPSTHNKTDYHKFKSAKARTTQMYTSSFGDQPKQIWDYTNMFESLHLMKARLKLRTVVIIGLLSFLVLLFPAFFLLKPIYSKINSSYFFGGSIVVILITFVNLRVFNRYHLRRILGLASVDSFIYSLQPFELVYLKTRQLTDVINGTLHELVDNGGIELKNDNLIVANDNYIPGNREQWQVVTTLKESGPQHYQQLLQTLLTKPVFKITESTMDALRKYIYKSREFGKLFSKNLALLLFLVLLLSTRLVVGISRDKPIVFICMLLIVFLIAVAVFLYRLTVLPVGYATGALPSLYKHEILPGRPAGDWQWQYFLLGAAVLAAPLAPLLIQNQQNSSSGTVSDSGSSNNSSCGSSCSSCGGCGGD